MLTPIAVIKVCLARNAGVCVCVCEGTSEFDLKTLFFTAKLLISVLIRQKSDNVEKI